MNPSILALNYYSALKIKWMRVDRAAFDSYKLVRDLAARRKVKIKIDTVCH